MELRHLRYFVAVAEQRSFLRAARHLRVAQPALSRQIRDLEHTLGVTLFHRLPRGVVLTPAGEAFLVEARNTLEGASKAIAAARRAEQEGTTVLHFAHGSEMSVYATLVADLVTEFRKSEPTIDVRVSDWKQTELLEAVRSHEVDVAATFLMSWPDQEFEAYPMLKSSLNGVLLGAVHPLASRESLQLRDLRDFTFISRSSTYWPENYRAFLSAFRERGLVPHEEPDRSVAAPSLSVQLAAGEAWSVANDELAEPAVTSSRSLVFRPFTDPAIPCWLALIWLPQPPERVRQLVDVARRLYPENELGQRSLGGQIARDGHRRAEAVVDVHNGDSRRAAV
jgi:DNA-binding transcriptional LysR family regulator